MKNILAIIPARAGSKGIPNKNFKNLAGKPLIYHTFKQIKLSKYITRTIVSTDSIKIKEFSEKNLIEAPFLRPKNISDDKSSSVSVVKHSLSFLKRTDNYTPKFVILLQPTSPLRSFKDIDNCLKNLISGEYDSVVSVTKTPKKYNPEWQFVLDKKGKIFPYDSKTDWNNLIVRRQNLSNTYTRNGAIYAFKTDNLKKHKNIYGENVLSYLMPNEKSINLDTMEDWNLVENFFKFKLHE